MLLNDLFYVFASNAAIESSLGIYDNDRTKSAKTEATGLDDLYLLGKTEGSEVFSESLLNAVTTRRGTTGTATDKNM
jgi:hypothetical protein